MGVLYIGERGVVNEAADYLMVRRNSMGVPGHRCFLSVCLNLYRTAVFYYTPLFMEAISIHALVKKATSNP